VGTLQAGIDQQLLDIEQLFLKVSSLPDEVVQRLIESEPARKSD